MKPHFLLCLTFLFCFSILESQAQSKLEAHFSEAQDEFENGRLNNVIELLEGYTYAYAENKAHRKNALQLLTKTYLFLDEQTKAKEIYLELLSIDPFYKIETNVPEMKYLKEKIETYPLSTYRIQGGVYLFSQPLLKKQFSPNNVVINTLNYNLDSIAAPIGSFISIYGEYKIFNSNWDVTFGYVNSTHYYYYNAALSNAVSPEGAALNANLHFLEKQRWSGFSIGLSHQFVKRSLVTRRSIYPFIGGRLSYQILHKGPNFIKELKIEFENGDNIHQAPFRVDDLRNRSNVSVELEMGLRVRSSRYFVEFGFKYNQFLNIIANGENRNNNVALVQTFNHLDDDFTFHNFGVFLGTGVYFFNSKTKQFIPL